MHAILRMPPADRYGVSTLNLTLKAGLITIAPWSRRIASAMRLLDRRRVAADLSGRRAAP
jgi:hypothetical protein